MGWGGWSVWVMGSVKKGWWMGRGWGWGLLEGKVEWVSESGGGMVGWWMG